MKKLVLAVCLAFLSINASAKLFEIFRVTRSIESKCGVTWNFVIHFNTPGEGVTDLQEIKAQIDSACGTEKTFFVS